MVPEQYVWLLGSILCLIPWGILYSSYPQFRHPMLWASVFTMPFGLAQPIFVPEYWNPPSLFNLAAKTGFDIESLIFHFGIGGTAVALYHLTIRKNSEPIPRPERRAMLHRYNDVSLATPFVLFALLYFFPWNPIYPGIIALLNGAVVIVLCRLDLDSNAWIGGMLFMGYCLVFLLGLEWMSPGYIDRVWNVGALSGIRILSIPFEQILFAFAFGAYWTVVYEHFTWHKFPW